MDDLYAINSAITQFRDAYNTGDVERLVAVFDPDIVDFSDHRGCAFFREGAADARRKHFSDLFSEYRVSLVPIVIEIRVNGNTAYDYGWHIWTLIPLHGSDAITRRERYVNIWRKNAAGQWKLWMFMNNEDVPMQEPQLEAVA